MTHCAYAIMFLYFVTCNSQDISEPNTKRLVENPYSAKTGNFSIECLYSTAKDAPEQNLVMSPITVYTALAVMSEGATGNTKVEITRALRLARSRNETTYHLGKIAQLLTLNDNDVKFAKINVIFLDKNILPQVEFGETSKSKYKTEIISVNFTASDNAAIINSAVMNITGKITSVVESSFFENSKMFLASAVHFKGQWTMPFNASATSRRAFYDNNGIQSGEVNMMYNRGSYPLSNINALQGKVIELPYGKTNHLSMLIILPNQGVPLNTMWTNFMKVSLDSIFEKLRVSKEHYSDYLSECLIPRFKIKSDLDLTNMIKNVMHIQNLFALTAQLPYLARLPVHASKLIHKAEIEVTEEGVTDSTITDEDEYKNRFGVARFEANRPFAFLVVEKTSNVIVLGGFYKKPSLY